jgi:hypothetical protein
MPRHVIRIEDLPEIQKRYAAGATSYHIAERYHCDPTTIQYWLNKTGCICSISDAKRQYQVRVDAFAEITDEAAVYQRDGLSSAPAFRQGDESPVARKGHALRLTDECPSAILVL